MGTCIIQNYAEGNHFLASRVYPHSLAGDTSVSSIQVITILTSASIGIMTSPVLLPSPFPNKDPVTTLSPLMYSG